MARLTGVKTLDMKDGEITKITYDGEEYTKVDGRAVVGDIIRAEKATLDVTRGAYYEVVQREIVTIIDDACDGHSNVLYEDKPDVFRKSTQSPQVSAPFAEMITAKVDAVEQRVTALEGAKPTQELAEGMRVKALANGEYNDIYTGEIGRITDLDAAGGDLGDPYSIGVVRDDDMLDYFRPQDLEIVTEDEEATFKIGDYVVFTKDYCEHVTGKVSVIRKLDFPSFLPYGLNTPQGELDGWAKDEIIRKATDAEVSEASRTVAKATAPTKPTTGDIVVITANTNGSRNAVGDIGKVGVSKTRITAQVHVPGKTKGSGNSTRYTEMRLATPNEKSQYYDAVEVERKKAEQAEAQAAKDAVFAKAGRKPNEYRKGDLVRLLADGEYPECVGGIFEVDEDVLPGISGGNLYTPCGKTFLADNVEIVCFAEDRVDIAKGGR